MKLRQKILALPLSAFVVFGLGVSASLYVASSSTAELSRLRNGDNRVLEATLRVDRLSDQLDAALESATMGDSKKLADARAIAADIARQLAPTSDALKKSFRGYSESSFAVVQGMMDGTDTTALLPLRHGQQARWNADRRAQVQQAKLAVESGFDLLEKALRNTVIISVLTALAVLAVLGVASWLTVRSIWRELGGEPDDLRRVSQEVAAGQLDMAVEPGIEGSLHAAMGNMTGRLRETVAAIREASDEINAAASEIAAGNQDLSDRTERTAASIEETSSAVRQLAAAVQDSGRLATEANRLAESASSVASQAGQVVSQVVSSMTAINESSTHITEIIGVIDAIAFQTNILALNAAVEAARAGGQGRGFAVVASEVRTLAGRSAQAASQIKDLIQASTEKVSSGSALVSEAGEVMVRVVESTRRVGEMIGGIAQASSFQANEIVSVSEAIVQLDGMTQQNAALVEQSAAAAHSLREQAHRLAATVSAFRLTAP